jgi:modulator of FtsH protease HflK
MSEHEHHHHPHPAPETAPVNPVDAGARALEEALRSSFVIVKLAMVGLAAVFLFSGMKTVGPQERAVILRFGKPIGTGAEQLLGPGLHWAFPYPIDEVVTIPITEIQKVTSSIGWYATTPEMEQSGTLPPPAASLNPAYEGYLVTADNNIIHARATLGYRITDPIAYTFNFTQAPGLIQATLNRALVFAAAHSTVDEAMLDNPAFKEKVLARVREQIAALNLGITIEQGSEVKVMPPLYVKPDFDAVTAAQQDRSTAENLARGQADALVRASETESNSIVRAAQTERVRTVQRVQADAKNFALQLPEYEKTPDLTRQRLLTETWQRILAGAPDKFFLPERADGRPAELRLLLSREPQKPKGETPAQP